MKRLFYLTDNIDSTEGISNDIHAAGIGDWNFHVLSRDEAGLYTHHVHSANWFQKYDLLRSGIRGGLIGIGIGILAVIILQVTGLLGFRLPLLGMLTTIVIFAMFSTWVGGLVGIQTENYKVARFHDALDQGKYLIMVDIDVGQEQNIKELMARRHPEAKPVGTDTSLVNPFAKSTAISQ